MVAKICTPFYGSDKDFLISVLLCGRYKKNVKISVILPMCQPLSQKQKA